ncbi:MAG: serine/threonine-protein kinase [Sandaracinus sp.]
MAIDVGSRIRDYEIIARLKAGGMATLFLARRVGAAGFSRHVAIKVVHPHLAEDQGFIRMFIDEALLSARIQHPNVVHVEELGEDKGTYFLAMEYVHGSALSTLLGSLAKLERRLSPDIAVWITMRLADGLHAAHELRGDDGQPLGVVHRDVSPQNVLLSMSGNVKLIDFGIAKAAGSTAKRTETGSLKGKLRYMAPEQAYGHAVDRRTDVYALGIVLWEMLTMHRMFSGPNDLMILDQVRAPRPVPPSELAPGIPPELDRVVLSALSPDPAARPPTAQDFRRWLGDALPAANHVDAGRVAEVLEAVLGERLEARRAALPESLSGLSLAKAEVPEERSMKRGVALRTMTLSAPGVQYHADQEVSAAPVDFQDASRRMGQSFASPPAATPAAPSGGRERLVALVAAAVALVAVSVLAGVLIAGRMGGNAAPAPSTVLVALPPPATPVAPAAPPPPTTEAIASTPEPTTIATPEPSPPPTTSPSRHGPRRHGGGSGSGGGGGTGSDHPSSVAGSVPIFDGFDD